MGEEVNNRLRLGICCGPDKARQAAAAGCDFIEPGFSGFLDPTLPEDKWATRAAQMEASPLRAESFNGLLRGELKVTGPEVALPKVAQYLQIGFRRARTCGAQRVVFGSGAARRVPEGFPRDQAETQIADFLKMAGDLAAVEKLALVIEPLQHAETNILNTLAEALAMARRVAHPAVKVLVDSFHMGKEKEPLEHIGDAIDSLAHVHISGLTNSRPGPGFDDTDYRPFLAALKKAGYADRVSMECGWKDFAADVSKSVTLVRQIWAEA